MVNLEDLMGKFGEIDKINKDLYFRAHGSVSHYIEDNGNSWSNLNEQQQREAAEKYKNGFNKGIIDISQVTAGNEIGEALISNFGNFSEEHVKAIQKDPVSGISQAYQHGTRSINSKLSDLVRNGFQYTDIPALVQEVSSYANVPLDANKVETKDVMIGLLSSCYGLKKGNEQMRDEFKPYMPDPQPQE